MMLSRPPMLNNIAGKWCRTFHKLGLKHLSIYQNHSETSRMESTIDVCLLRLVVIDTSSPPSGRALYASPI